MKTKFGIIIAIIAIVGIGVYFYTSNNTIQNVAGTEKEKVADVNEDSNKDISETNDLPASDSETESELIEEFPIDMSESDIQSAIHHMSHTKVYAEEKWGYLVPSQGKIDRLLEVVKENSDEYIHSELYISILERWSAGDFSNAVEDHNDIWDLQGGTIGEATRLLTEEEEEDYTE